MPVDQFLDWYPGWTPELTASPWVAEQTGPFTKEDEERFWFVDFHWPRGFSPLGFLFVTDCAAWGTQTAAHRCRCRPAGARAAHGRAVPLRGRGADHLGVGARLPGRPHRANMPRFLQNFDAIWEERKWELELGLGYFESYDFAGKSLADIGQYIADARTFHRRAWEIHFEIMYPLLAIYLQLYGLCASNGIDPGNVAKLLQGRDSKIMETDRAMWDLADEAKRLGIADLFDTEPEQIRDPLAKAGGNASVWLTKFDDFLKVYGWRTEGIADINIPSWIENQASPLGQIRNFLAMDEPHDFDKAAAAARAERDEAIEAARSQLTRRDARRVQRAAGHQPGRQLRLVERGPQLLHRPAGSIPLRRGALAIGAASAPTPTTTRCSSSSPSSIDVCAGRQQWKDLQSIATARHEYYDHYHDIRGDAPEGVGTLPDKIEDPVLIEIFGMHHHYFEGLKADADATVLNGFPASAGRSRDGRG